MGTHSGKQPVGATARIQTRRRHLVGLACRLLQLSMLLAAYLLMSGELTAAEPPIKVGMIGLDTSHVILFTKLLNVPNAADDMAGVRIVAAYPGGSDDLPISRDRVKGFTEQLRGMGIEIVDSIEALLPKVDAVMLESVDGRCHLQQAVPVIQAGKPLFVDKPAAASLADVIRIFRLAKEHNVPVFSCSSNRFATQIEAVRGGRPDIGSLRGCDICGPCASIQHHPTLYFYGIHGIEMLYALMGRGCVSVSCVATPSTLAATGVWQDGRVGTYRGIRPGGGASEFSGKVFGEKGIASVRDGGEDEALMRELVKFFKTGKPPLSAEETIEIFAFMDAAEESSRQGGKPVAIADVLKEAHRAAANRIHAGV